MVPLKQILCPVDFSEFSRHAFDRAVGVARCYGATVTALHVLPVSSAIPAVPYGPEGPGPFGRDTIDRHRVLEEFPRFLRTESSIGVPVLYQVTEGPRPHKEILLQADLVSADVIVMGTHGRSGFERLLLGSVTEKVLRTSRIPVMTVPASTPDVTPPRDPFRRVLYATDFSTGSEHALRYAASLAEHAAGQLTLVHVVEPLPVGYDPIAGTSFDVATYHAGLVRDARARLRGSIPEAVRLACDTDEVVAIGKPSVEILRVALERQSDLIVLGIHGRNPLDRLVFGSTAEHLVRRATVPVLTVREPQFAS